ncbi:MAG TPA: Gfo/Idh/MocA family oxidoreductase, partial [Propionibacteriaceae bacterium]|nr:Gfo/Idh/MocA family oxidoreductase [Propionibacteriaceae bacterium]
MSSLSESDHRIRLALVGAGVIGTIHGAVISELTDRIDLVAVVDLHPERAEKLAAEHGATAFTSLTDALQAVDVDVVAVCTPTGRHGEVALEALEAGKHVIIEKPAETTVAKTDEIIAAQRRAGTQVAVISQHRFDPATEVALAAIGNGELGRLTSGIASIDWWRGQTYYDSG